MAAFPQTMHLQTLPESLSLFSARLAMHLSSTHLLGLSLLLPALPALFHHFYHDYQVFISLGPGGTPKTITGYLRVKLLSLFALSNPLSPPAIPPHLTPQTGHLRRLPQRSGPRPRTAGIAPHRQLEQTSAAHIFAHLDASLLSLASTHDPPLRRGTSCFEKHGTGLFADYPARRTCSGEICHAHPSDGSLHLTLHPADARQLLLAGWGERHPLARGGWLERFVPGGFVMVYAPRDEREVEICLEIVKAAAWWVGGEEAPIPGTRRRDSGCDVESKDGCLVVV